MMYSRRTLILAGLSVAFVGNVRAENLLDEENFDWKRLPPPEAETDFPIEPANLRKIKKRYRRQDVEYPGDEKPGTIVVMPKKRYLYHVLKSNRAVRYGVGVGRRGFQWSGDATVGMKRRWPRWVPPSEMVDRDERAAKWPNGMPGGPDNPLGARALYLFQNGKDTLFRIHGTNEPNSIGKAVSSGCIRMLNEDIAELYDHVEIGSPVSVKPAD
jgi:lipoprotein-anchoring transpeptidase ErfK/SrfK